MCDNFVWKVIINHCVNNFPSCIHKKYLWLDHKISIDAHLIHRIIGLLMEGEDPTSLFENKHEDKGVDGATMEKHGAKHGYHGIRIKDINNRAIQF